MAALQHGSVGLKATVKRYHAPASSLPLVNGHLSTKTTVKLMAFVVKILLQMIPAAVTGGLCLDLCCIWLGKLWIRK